MTGRVRMPLWHYGMLGMPLAFVALPLYVQWPAHFAQQYGVSLGALGLLLLSMRMLDAVTDPTIGRWADKWLAHSRGRSLAAIAAAGALILSGFVALFFAPDRYMSGSVAAALAWAAAALLVSHAGLSMAQVVHQAWGAGLGGDAERRARIAGSREVFALCGVFTAILLPAIWGWAVTAATLAILLALGGWLLRSAPFPLPIQALQDVPDEVQRAASNPWRVSAFRWLLLVYVLSGLASAIPATLLLFFIRDRLQAPHIEALALLAYFLAAAASVPIWLRLVKPFGLVQVWLAGMLISVTAFAWASTLTAGDTTAFIAICLATGMALGAELSVPSALLAGVIQRQAIQARSEGVWIGWWNFATKLNLALAAGLALPLLTTLGYQPGSREAEALTALTLAYCALPCALKSAALIVLWRRRRDWEMSPDSRTRSLGEREQRTS